MLFEIGSTTAQLGRLFESGLDLQPRVDIATLPHPGPQPVMPDAVDAPVVPAVDVFDSSRPDLDAITVPDLPLDLQVTQQKGINIMGVSFASAAGVFFGPLCLCPPARPLHLVGGSRPLGSLPA